MDIILNAIYAVSGWLWGPPLIILLSFKYAFIPAAPIGGFGGAAIATVVRWGFARGVYSNEAGGGTAPIAHAAATTDYPVRARVSGLWSES